MVFPFMDPLKVLFCILIQRSSCHTLCNWMAPILCDSLHESSPDVEKLLSLLLHFNGCFLPGSSDGTSSLLIMKISCHTLCNWMAYLQCDSLHDSSPDVEKLLSYLVHFNGCFLHVLDPEKLLPHFMQLNGFSQVWFPSCYLCCTYKKLQYYDMAV